MLVSERNAQNVRRPAWAAQPSRQRDRKRAVLFVLQGPEQGVVLSVPETGVRIGSGSRTAFRLSSGDVAPQHAQLSSDGHGWTIESASASHATFVNNRRVEQKTRLADGDRLRFGRDTIVKFCLVDELEERALHALFELTLLDPLTRLYNRKHITERLQSEFSYARRHAAQLAVLFIDIDHFKRVNDAHGHPVGDMVLKAVSASIARSMRPEDVLGRYGGEEFVIVARNISLRNAEILAERIRRLTEKQVISIGSVQLRVTISIGVAVAGPHAFPPDADSLLTSADEALYNAKHAGRNRVSTIPPQGKSSEARSLSG